TEQGKPKGGTTQIKRIKGRRARPEVCPERSASMDRKTYWRWFRRTASAALLYVMIAEWIWPLAGMPHWTQLYAVEPILLTLAAMLAADALRLPAALAIPVKAFAA